MQVIEALWVSRYAKILKYNGKTPEEIKILTKEYINYLEGVKTDNLSEELTEFLLFLAEQEKEETKGRGK